MQNGLIEIIGLFLVVVGAGGVVAAACMVAVALGVLAAGVFILLGGLIAVYVANARETRKPAAGDGRP